MVDIKGMKLQEKTQRKINEKKKEIEKQNKEKYSFRPHINPVSFSVLYKRMTTHSACNDEDNIITIDQNETAPYTLGIKK